MASAGAPDLELEIADPATGACFDRAPPLVGVRRSPAVACGGSPEAGIRKVEARKACLADVQMAADVQTACLAVESQDTQAVAWHLGACDRGAALQSQVAAHIQAEECPQEVSRALEVPHILVDQTLEQDHARVVGADQAQVRLDLRKEPSPPV